MEEMKLLVTLEPDETGMMVAECPVIPGCVSQGADEAERTLLTLRTPQSKRNGTTDMEVCNIAMAKAGIGRGSEGADIPNLLFKWLFAQQAQAAYPDSADKPKKPKITSKICYDTGDGKHVCP